MVSRTVDLYFRVHGDEIPLDHGYSLFSAISRALETKDHEWIHDSKEIGLHLIRGKYQVRGLIRLDKNSRIGIRVKTSILPSFLSLAGKSLSLGQNEIRVGIPFTTELRPSTAVYARTVTTRNGQDENRFDIEIKRQLDAKNILGKPIRGRRRIFRIKDKKIVGHSLLITELLANEAILLQELGLGGRRKMGCGVFVPWRG